ncbi:MAG: NAD-dependent epimerase/dehydratase family protein [Anaerolineae bacterium]|nr:NAD-dependent epimerase/dehydratase family protein [Anaerolineae bacterium]
MGANIVEALIARGYTVSALRRESSKLTALNDLEPDMVVGDIMDVDSLRSAMGGCKLVFHAAAMSQYWRSSLDLLYQSNVTGTRNVLEAARASGVERVVVTSSVAVLGIPTREREVLDESAAFNWAPGRFHYGHSKLLAEAEVARAVANGMDVLCVNPATVIGRRDVYFVSGEILRTVRRGLTWIAPAGGMGIVAAEAVGLGHVLAAERGRSGERYILNGENLAHADFLALVAAVVGGRSPCFAVPKGASRVAVALVRGIIPFDERSRASSVLSQLELSGLRMYFDGGKAERELGVPRMSARAAVEDAWTWYRREGLL